MLTNYVICTLILDKPAGIAVSAYLKEVYCSVPCHKLPIAQLTI